MRSFSLLVATLAAIVGSVLLTGCSGCRNPPPPGNPPLVLLEATFGSAAEERARRVVAYPSENKYWILGETANANLLAIEIDAQGYSAFSKRIIFGQNSGLQEAFALHKESDNRLIIGSNSGFKGFTVCAIERNANPIWSYSYEMQGAGGEKVALFKAVDLKPAPDGGYYVVGYYFPEANSENGDVFILKLSSDGRVDTGKSWTFSSTESEFASGMAVDKAGNIYVSGHRKAEGKQTFAAFAMKVNADGELQWCKTVKEDAVNCFNPLIAVTDSSLVLLGSLSNDNSGISQLAFMTLNHAGQLMQSVKLESPSGQAATYLAATSTGFLITGYTNDNATDVLAVSLTPQGQVNWAKSYGGGSIDDGSAIFPTPENGYIIVGTSESFSTTEQSQNGKADIYAIKTDGNGIARCNTRNYNLTSSAFSPAIDDISNRIRKQNGRARSNPATIVVQNANLGPQNQPCR
jgi:hypothetical protein